MKTIDLIICFVPTIIISIFLALSFFYDSRFGNVLAVMAFLYAFNNDCKDWQKWKWLYKDFKAHR